MKTLAPLLLVSLACLAASPAPIEEEFARLERERARVLTLVGMEGAGGLPHLVARSDADAPTEGIMRIEHAVDIDGGRRFRIYYLRDGAPELLHEYFWGPRPGQPGLGRHDERRLRFENGRATAVQGRLRPGEAPRRLRDARRFHALVIEQRRRIQAEARRRARD